MNFNVKKVALVLALALVSALVFAQDAGGDAYYGNSAGSEEVDFYYFNLPIVKIFNHPRGYYIVYRTSGLKTGSMCIPFEWMDRRDQRAVYNTVRVGVSPYISYVMNNGEFYQVRINASVDSLDPTWGITTSGKVPDEYFDVDTVTLQF